MPDETDRRRVSVRMEGGLGDHLLAMRILRHVHARYPEHAITVYSASGTSSAAMDVVRLSPLVSAVVPLVHGAAAATLVTTDVADPRLEDRTEMMAADQVFDTCGSSLFAAASIALDVPIFDILAHRPTLMTMLSATQDAARCLPQGMRGDALFVGLNLSKYGNGIRGCYRTRIAPFLRALLSDERVIILNLFTSTYDYPRWPEPLRAQRRAAAIEDALFHLELAQLSDRVIPCVDLPIATVAALLERCRYFIGVDNGIKHLAWALGIPHTFFHPDKPELAYVLRWIPDLHRMLLFDSSDAALEDHVRAAIAALEV